MQSNSAAHEVVTLSPDVQTPGDPSPLAWACETITAMACEQHADGLARVALQGVLKHLNRVDGMVVATNRGGLINDLVPSRTLVLASSGQFAELQDTSSLPDPLATAIELKLAHPDRDAGSAIIAASLPTGERVALVFGHALQPAEADAAHVVIAQAAAQLSVGILRRVNTTDPLTGLPNLARGLHVLRNALMFAARIKSVTSIVRFQIDGIQRLEENFGSSATELVIRAVARATRATCRRTDLITPVDRGGFILILPATPLSGGLRVAESLREYLSALRVDFEGRELHVTISSGVAASEVGTTDARHLLRRAEQAMSDIEGSGGNRVGTAALTVRRATH